MQYKQVSTWQIAAESILYANKVKIDDQQAIPTNCRGDQNIWVASAGWPRLE